MIRKQIILSIILSFIILLSSCYQPMKYPKYEMEKQDNGQYVLTSPDGISYVTYENLIWFSEEILTGYDYNEAIGRCDVGYVYDTDSEICIFTDDLRGSRRYIFFLEGTVLPEFSIENISSAVLKATDDRESQIIVDEQAAEKLIELYSNTDSHEIINIYRMERIWELDMECEEYIGLFFSKSIYKHGNDYYMYIASEYDSKNKISTYFVSECTSVIETILEKN